MAYATLDELKANYGNKSASKHDTQLTTLLVAAEKLIDRFCNRATDGFTADSSATARVYVGTGESMCWTDENVEVTAIAVKTSTNETSYTSWASTDWVAATGRPSAPDFNRTPYTFVLTLPTGAETAFTSGLLGPVGTPTVEVTAKWGYAATGDAVFEILREATIAQTLRWYERFQGGFSDALAGDDFPSMLFRKSLDPDIKHMLIGGNLKRPKLATMARF